MSIVGALEDAGHVVVGAAATAEQAERIAAEAEPEFVLMDLNLLGGRDGVSAALAIRSYSEVPILFLTAQADAQSMERMNSCRPVGVMSKPYDDEDLLATIESKAA
jgi:CheY-like chemotaxis protein